MENSTNPKRRRNSFDSITEGEEEKSNSKTCQQKQFRKNNNDLPKLFLPHNNQKYSSRTYWIPTLPNTTSTITHLNPQATLPVPFSNERLNITIIITIEH